MSDGSQVCTERTPRVVAARKLLRRAGRERAGRFLAEGAQAVGAAVASAAGERTRDSTGEPTREPTRESTGAHRPARVYEVFTTEVAAERNAELLAAAAAIGVPVSVITERAAETLS
ncbi:MAG: methyltransferase, TrmH family, partial [Pseudonocardiales bacterium]|nr:methyltransferase, TrmH family [Pseudonocardiales bacterium]